MWTSRFGRKSDSPVRQALVGFVVAILTAVGWVMLPTSNEATATLLVLVEEIGRLESASLRPEDARVTDARESRSKNSPISHAWFCSQPWRLDPRRLLEATLSYYKHNIPVNLALAHTVAAPRAPPTAS